MTPFQYVPLCGKIYQKSPNIGNTIMITPLMNIAIKAARSASKIIVRAIDRLDTLAIEEKKSNDFVTEIDKMSELEIVRVIRESYPDHAILGEEGGAVGEHDYTWIIDPIDGTTNFIHGHPHFCISIGIKHKDQMEHGLIYDPLRQEMFTATLGNGAFLNERRIRVSQSTQLMGSTIASSFNSSVNNHDFAVYLKILATIIPQAAGTRRSGSAALDCAYVACGRLDALWGIGCYAPWDIAAGTLIIKEAGGIVTDFDGEGNYLAKNNLVAANAYLSKILLQIINEKSVPVSG
jgi:myo-inositol-1(or 4)-monophosphatase